MTTHQMSFVELTLNPSVDRQAADRLGRQQRTIWRLFERRESGRVRYVPVSTNQLRQAAAQYCARINELRTWLRNYNLTIDKTRHDRFGNHTYVVRDFEGSQYQQLLQKKGLA